MRTSHFVITAFLLAVPASVHAQARQAIGSLRMLPQEATPRIGRYVELVVDDQGDGLAAGLFDLPINPAVHTIVLFPEDIERGRGFPEPDFTLEIQGQQAAFYTMKRRLPKGLQRNVTLFSQSLAVGFMVTAVDDPDDAVALAVVRSRSQVERWEDEYEGYVADRQRQQVNRAAVDLVLHMRPTPVRPKTVLGDAMPRARGVAQVALSNVQGVWLGPDEMVVKFELENTGTTAFEWAESHVYGKDREKNHAGAARILEPAEPSEGLVGRLRPDQRARAAVLVERVKDLSGPMTIVLQEPGGGRPVMATVGHWIPMQQPTHNIQMLELRPVEPPDPERGKVSLHLQGVYGAVWLGDGAGLDESDATSLKGLGVRAQYAFNRWLAFEGEIMGAGTGDARFEDVSFEGMQGDLTRSAALGRAQFGGVLRFGEGPWVPLVRLGMGLQGAGHSGTLTTATGDVPGPESFELDALWHFGAGLDLRLGNHLVAGFALTSVLTAKSTSPDVAAQLSIEAGIHLGYAWKP